VIALPAPMRRWWTFVSEIRAEAPAPRVLRRDAYRPEHWRALQRRAAQAAFPPNPDAQEREDLS
jgi:hypothetical protein